jgi:hypothetical protein
VETIAVTIWRDIISPLYDAACRILIVRSDGSRVHLDVRDFSIAQKAETCAGQGVTVMICGAISNCARSLLEQKGIAVIPWIRGPVGEVLDAYGGRRNLSEDFAMPGCRCNPGRTRGRYRRRGGGCGRKLR